MVVDVAVDVSTGFKKSMSFYWTEFDLAEKKDESNPVFSTKWMLLSISFVLSLSIDTALTCCRSLIVHQ